MACTAGDLLFYRRALYQARYMLEGLVVHGDNMMKDLKLTDGLVNTEAVMMALAPRMGRGEATTGWQRFVSLLPRARGGSSIYYQMTRRLQGILIERSLNSCLRLQIILAIREKWSIVSWPPDDAPILLVIPHFSPTKIIEPCILPFFASIARDWVNCGR